MSAWASETRLTLGQVAVEAKSNEITAVPLLLELLELKGATVTLDAMGCQKEIARKIIERGGQYLLALKDNQPTLHAPQTSAMLRRLAVSILSADTSVKDSLRGKRYRACLSTDSLEAILRSFVEK